MSTRKWIFLAGISLILVVINYQIYHKEQVLNQGQLVLLDLAPRDPRSLIQGDYMALRYSLSNDMRRSGLPNRGYVIVTLDEHQVASFLRAQDNPKTQNDNEHAIRYFKNRWGYAIGADEFFFQEGLANRYDSARYGAMRITPNGESVLVSLYDRQYQDLAQIEVVEEQTIEED